MPTVLEVLRTLETIAPRRFALSFDRIGLQIGDPAAEVTQGVVSLDRSLAAAKFASELGAQLLICHHPLVWDPLKSVTAENHVGKTVLFLIENKICFIAAHTNWDAAQGGINDTLASRLGLNGVTSFGYTEGVAQLKVVVFAPVEAVNGIIEAASAAGAGIIGLYERCAFTSPGKGTFLALSGAVPTLGSVNNVEEVEETRIEMVLPEARREAVALAIHSAHPYEEPAFDFFRLADKREQPMGRVGLVTSPMSLGEFALLVDSSLQTRCLTWGDPGGLVKRVAVCGGAADSEWSAAKAAGADVFVTGEVKQQVALEASESGMAIIAAGHYATEHPGCEGLRERLVSQIPGVEWSLFTPGYGFGGRPF